MFEKKNIQKLSAKKTSAPDMYSPTVGIREKLIAIFLVVKIIPLILLAVIAWFALVDLGDSSRETAVTDSKEALTALAVENIERMTTDTAQKVAEFLYQRDAEITFLAKACGHFNFDQPGELKRMSETFFTDFGDARVRMIRKHGDWKVADDGMSWIRTDPYIPPAETKKRSVNTENEDEIDGVSFHYRPPYGYNDHRDNFRAIPIYDEIALLDKNGMQIAKYVTPNSTKKRFPFPKELLDVSDPKNTFVKAERYFEELPKLGKDGIYVSDVIGAYTPTRFIGMYTPDYIASRRIDTKIAELEAELQEVSEAPTLTLPHKGRGDDINETIWQLRILNASLKNEGERFNSLYNNDKIRAEIDRRLGKGKIWKIEEKTLQQVAQEIEQLGFPDLADDVLNTPFSPEDEAYAGAENPLGVRFEGIVRWVKPVLDDNGEVKGYVTFAMNHDHLLEMINHITPMPARYSELSNAFDGNYAFIWDYKCRSIVHPRHHSICGYNPETGLPETPWLEKTIYEGMIAAGYPREKWQDYIATLKDYVPWTGDKNSLAFQSRSKRPAAELTQQGLVGLDGRYLNNAPQCTGWMDLAKDGGSGSLFILWSGVYKLNTAAAIPYYTGQYAPEVRGNRCGFGFVAVGAGMDDFSRPANEMGERLSEMVQENISETTWHLIWTTGVLCVVVIFVAIWMASYLAKKLQWLIDGITSFQRGNRGFRFATAIRDEFGKLARSFDDMAEGIVRSVHTPLVITDLNLKIVYINEQTERVLGKTSEELIGSSYKDQSIYPFGSEYCPITSLLSGRENTKELFVKRTNQYLLGIANYFTDEYGAKLGYIITSNDVTDLSRTKIEAELANKHKSLFLARMSHELRTPMNAMIGLNEITQSQLAAAAEMNSHHELNDFLTQLKGSSLHLLDLLNDILDASNLESGAVTLVEKPLDFQGMLDDLAIRMEAQCAEKNIKWVSSFDSFQSSHFITDGLRLRQVLTNLLDNAFKYTTQGEINFSVREKERKNDKIFLSFTIRDTGAGISQKGLDKIFHPFEQMDSASGIYTTGSGLGLAIVKKILELFGSQIQVQSKLNKGSEFSFDLWLTQEHVVKKIDYESLKNYFVGHKALVIDDVRLNRLVLVNLLQEMGFGVDEAKDGKEGLDMFEQSQVNEYSIVFMDIQMPVMNGYESAMAIRNLSRKDAAAVPIVTISANAFKEDVEKSLANGMNAHYAKPIQKDVLAEILETYCVKEDSGTVSSPPRNSNVMP